MRRKRKDLETLYEKLAELVTTTWDCPEVWTQKSGSVEPPLLDQDKFLPPLIQEILDAK